MNDNFFAGGGSYGSGLNQRPANSEEFGRASKKSKLPKGFAKKSEKRLLELLRKGALCRN
ncbi:MAG: hypothetical protein J6P03_00260 [Opitutales bacterium]|nr:hypothetical protein [Opitutales bacterium]